MPKLSVSDIEERAAQGLQGEDYSVKSPIQGVRIVEIKNFTTEDGYFMELARAEAGIYTSFAQEQFEIKQINLSKSMPHTVKAWHLHFAQEDVWFVPPESKILAGLVDVRKNSPTRENTMRIVLGEGKTQLLYIPRGVAHGYMNITSAPIYILYFVNNQFNPQDSDERRLPWDHFGKDFWEIKKG